MAEHFDHWAWAGFAGKSVPAAVADGIRGHLAAGCESCAREASFWRVLGSTLRLDREPLPAGWLERALAHASAGSPRFAAPFPGAGVIGARLAFDNFTAPQASAVRGLHVRRHCVYELNGERGLGRAPQGSVEVMVERVSRNDGWSVVGQVLSAAGEGWRDCTVELIDASDPVSAGVAGTARTNAFGEFALAQTGGGPWRLDLQVGENRWGINPLLMP